MEFFSKTTDEFVNKLKEANVSLLVDIRISPYCSFNKDFSSENMDEILGNNQIRYVHFVELGNIYKENEDPIYGENAYAEFFKVSGEFVTRRLRKEIQEEKGAVCILCACKEYQYCHRNVVSGFLSSKFGVQVKNL